MPRYRTAVLGGTFDHLHRGHEALLLTALRAGRTVAVGLTTARYLAGHPKPDGRRIQPFATRRKALARWLSSRAPARRWRIVPIDDRYGGSTEPGVGVLVASADTLAGARAVNTERRRLRRRPVPILVVPLVLADDLEPISSHRIRAGLIDRSGRRQAPIVISVESSALDDRQAVRRGLQRVFPRVRWVARPSGASTEGRISVQVVRRSHGGWSVSIRGARVRLPASLVPRTSRGGLAGGVERLLQPGRATGTP